MSAARFSFSTVPENDGSATTPQGRARREQLLQAALTAFAARGYRGASLASIASDVQISQPGLLHHFPTKEHLLVRVLEYHEDRNTERIEMAIANASLADGLLDLARHHEANPEFIRLFVVLAAESVDPEHPAHDWFVERYRHIRVWLRAQVADEQRRGRMTSAIDPDTITQLLVSVLDGLELQHLLDTDQVQIAAPLSALLDILR
jgi:AcrR family transcriptional regulator